MNIMIFRKPFAFFIKHFKLIHLILTICAIFLIIKTNHMLSFYLEYMELINLGSSTTISTDLFSPILLVCIVVMIFGSLLIATIMRNKKKPIMFYVVNMIIYVFLAGVYMFSYSTIENLDMGLVGIRTLKLLQDFLVISMMVQVLSVIILMIRTLGFDIKKFDFERDLEELQITSEDSEEVEINLEFDFDKLKRDIRKSIRHFKYVYVENKTTINIVALILTVIIGIVVYLHVGVYNRIYHENQFFKVTNYQMGVRESYLVNTNNQKEIISNNTIFVIINTQIQSYFDTEIKFQSARISLKIKDHLFHHQKKYKGYFDDLGTVYENQKIGNEKKNYLLVFEIPKEYQNEKMILKYSDYNNKEINITLHPNRFSDTKLYNYHLGDKIEFKDSILGNSTLQITETLIQDQFKNEYEFCVTKSECIPSYEYLTPTYTGNGEKALLRIKGTVSIDENNRNENLEDLYDFMKIYSKMIYIIQGEEKEMHINWKQVKAKKKKEENTYYIEVPKELKDAEKIYIDFMVRDKEYKYAVK